MADIIDEGSNRTITIDLTDEVGADVTANTVEYRIDCMTNDAQIRDWKSIVPASTMTIKLTSTDNAIINRDNAYETRLLTIKVTHSNGLSSNKEFSWWVKTLQKLS